MASCVLIETQDSSIDPEQAQTPKFGVNDECVKVYSLNEMFNSCFISSSSRTTSSPKVVLSSEFEFRSLRLKMNKKKVSSWT